MALSGLLTVTINSVYLHVEHGVSITLKHAMVSPFGHARRVGVCAAFQMEIIHALHSNIINSFSAHELAHPDGSAPPIMHGRILIAPPGMRCYIIIIA